MGKLCDGDALAVDGEVLSESMLRSFKEKLPIQGLRVLYDRNLVGEIWQDRPAVPEDPVWELEPQYAVESRTQKLSALRKCLQKYGKAASTLLCGLDDIAWLTILRGNDNPLYPFFHSYAYVSQKIQIRSGKSVWSTASIALMWDHGPLLLLKFDSKTTVLA